MRDTLARFSTWFAFVGMALINASARAQSYAFTGYEWYGDRPRIPYWVSDSLVGNVPTGGMLADAIGSVRTPAETWNIEGASHARLVCMGTTSVNTVADDGINAVIFDPGQCPVASGCVAACFVHTTGSEMRGFDIVYYRYAFGSSSPWTYVAKETAGLSQHNVLGIGLHEFGHALGLAHPPTQSGQVMVPSANNNVMRVSAADRQGLQALYGQFEDDGIWVIQPQTTPGAWVQISLRFPSAASASYQIIVGEHGDLPGTPLQQIVPGPANHRRLLVNQPFLDTSNTARFSGFQGVLDSTGAATASMLVAPTADRGLALGVLVYSAYTTTGVSHVAGPALIDVGKPVIHVPADFATIQAAIDSTSSGSFGARILVAPGTYAGGLDFHGRRVRVQSEAGAVATILDGGQLARVATFAGGENEWTTLEGFTLRNGAAQDGAGLACLYAATPRLSDLVIEDNAASATGGGVLCFFGAAPQFVRCVLRGNSAQSGAGAYTRLKSFPHFVSCRVVDNTAVLDGGGLYLGSWNSSDASLPALTEHVEGCVIADNHAGRDGGGALTWTNAADPPKRILCSTIAANQAGNRGGGVYTHANNSSYPIAASLSNTIVWANTAPTQAGVAYNASAPTLDHCDVQPGDPLGSSGISVDPEFLSPANGDFRVDCGSPVIDNGSTAALPPDVADLDGDGDSSEALPLDASGATRVTNGVVDIGAHEGPTLPETYCTAKTNSQGCVPAVGFSGSASTSSSSPFTISATNVLNLKSGLLFYGSGSNAAPFQGGTLCVQTPVRRTPIQSSNGNPPPEDCSGAYSLDFNALIQSSADPLLVPGARCFAQFWSRDPASPSTTGLTDALSFWICP